MRLVAFPRYGIATKRRTAITIVYRHYGER
ncbi:hypothetical protein J2Z50_006621 [Ensifer mexicanus]|nr:hypothetical protein [Sinorhizobium mexicanum]